MAELSNKAFLGKGLGRPLVIGVADEDRPASLVTVDAQGKLERARFEDAVRLSIWSILGTAKGERVMRPDFGCALHELVFSPVNAGTAGRVSSAVREALIKFETRIFVRDVQVTPSGAGVLLLVSIEYEVRATNNVFNLVYPFYLQGGGV
jgi:phage baseplate assembly protein W